MPTIKKFLYGKIKKSNLFNLLPINIRERINKKYEKELYKCFRKHIKDMAEISNELKPATREECFDRYYINDYVEMNKDYIYGDVLEFAGGDVVYAKKYGNNPNVKIMAGLNHKEAYPNADYWADLQKKETLPEQKFDCIVATQVIMYMEDLTTTLENLKYMLKPEGRLILTVPGPIFHHSKNSHHMFSFTEESIKFLCKKVFNNYENFKCYGNLEYVQYMLYWMKKNPSEKPVNNEYSYTLVMGIVTRKHIL